MYPSPTSGKNANHSEKYKATNVTTKDSTQKKIVVFAFIMFRF